MVKRKLMACALAGTILTCYSGGNICMAEGAETADDTTKGNYIIQAMAIQRLKDSFEKKNK